MNSLEIASIISAPLVAASNAHSELCQATKDFIDSCMTIDGSVNRTPQEIAFEYERYSSITETTEYIVLRVPLICILTVPSLGIDNVSVDMTVEVNQVEDTTTQQQPGTSVIQRRPYIFRGQLSSTNKTLRKTNHSSSFTVAIQAKQQPQPEGLARLLDILNNKIEPDT